MYADYQRELDYIGQSAIDNVPDQDWVKIELTARSFGGCMEVEAWYWQAGESEAIEFEPDYELGDEDDNGILDVFENIKWEIYQLHPQEGTWIECVLNFDRDHDYTIDFEYDAQPVFYNIEGELETSDYIEEWESYPRTRANTPEWWLEILKHNGIEVGDTLPEAAGVPSSSQPGHEPPLSS